MPLDIKHAFQSALPDDPDAGLVRPSNWNASHTITGAVDAAQHGNLAGGALHAEAVANGAAGFLSGVDKAKLDVLASTFFLLSAVSGTNVVLATSTPTFAAYPVGLFLILFANAPTGAVTLNVNTLGPLPLLTPGGAAMVTDSYEASVPYLLYCNGTEFRFLAAF